MEYSSKNARKWSRMGERPVFGLTVLEMAKEHKDIIALAADVASSAGLERMKMTLPEQFLDTGIAEQNMMGIAAGLASEGYRVVATTFAPFQSMRCLEQIRVNLGYMGVKVCMAGLASGFAYGELGNTHCCFEDVAIMRAIPNIAVVSPADCMEVAKTVEAALQHDTSVYIRLMGKKDVPVVYAEDYDFQLGKAITLREGVDIAIVATGTMVARSLQVADILDQQGISATVVDMHTIKPLDTGCLDKLCEHNLLVTVEEHNVCGGLGSAVAEYLAPKKERPSQLLIGVEDFFPHAGSYEYVLQQCGLTAEQIAARIRDLCR